MRHCILPLWILLLVVRPAPAQESLIVNGGFENGLTGWDKFWSRETGGHAELDSETIHSGTNAIHIEHTGETDWSFPQTRRLTVEPGDLFELTGWLKLNGPGTATLTVILYDAQGKPLSWALGGQTLRSSDTWRELKCRFVVPQGGATILPRLMGQGPSVVWMDDCSLKKTGTLAALRKRDLPDSLSLRADWGSVEFHTVDGSLTFKDARTGRTYRSTGGSAPMVLDARASQDTISFQLLTTDDTLTVDGSIQLDAEKPEILVSLHATGSMQHELAFPRPFASQPGDFLIMPVNEGISYPVDDATLPAMHYHLYGGHGLCMAFWGMTDLKSGMMAIVETADDAAVRVDRFDKKAKTLCLAPNWLPQKTDFGPERRIRYVLLESGGYVSMCKRYRQYAKDIGRFRTLAEKREVNPNVDQLVGAVNVWCWDQDPVGICRELQELGIERILYSRRSSPEQLRTLNAMNVLSSRYDIYQDVMNPENFPKLHGRHADWPTEAWPGDIVLQENGEWARGWRVKGKDGEWYPCGVLCDIRALDYARKRIPEELVTHPYRSRFIDTTTAAPWRECFHPAHPMTRTESRLAKVELLRIVSEECGLVTGSETGHDAVVPVAHYFEGMLSLGPYRVPDSGRDMIRVVEQVPERVAKFQTGHYYRLPLWELVYHDCVVAQWYWGDYNNKLPELWDRRDLFNALYGTPPMFMFNRRILNANKQRFLQSYRTATPVARATGYSEMLTHQWLTRDHSVQRTQFANGVSVTVNFGDSPFTAADGQVIAPLSRSVEGL